MLDYTNNGAQNPANGQKLSFNERDLLVGKTVFTIAAWLRRTRSPWAASGIVSERNGAVAGWDFRLDSAYNPRINVIGATSVGSSTATALNTLTLSVLVLNVTTYQFYRDNGSADGNGAWSGSPGDPGVGLTLGDTANNDLTGFAGQIGHIIIWPDIALSQADVQTLYGGTIPYLNDVRFWHRGTALPGKDEYSKEEPTQSGSIWLKSLDPPDGYYADQQIITALPEMPIQIAGQDLHRRRLPLKEHALDVPLELLGRELIDDLLFTHSGGLEPTGKGYGMDAEAPERMVRLTGMTLHPGAKRISLAFHDLRRFAVTLYDQLIAPYSVSTKQLGAFRVYPAGVTKEITRDSNAWVEQSGGAIVKISKDQEPLTRLGLLVESERTNEFKNSAFSAGVATDWTALNTGVNGSAVADDTTDLLFDSEVSEKSCEITAGDPLGASPVGIQQQITLASGDSTIRKVSLAHKDDSGQALSLKIQRSTDSYYRTSLTSDTWAATETYLDLPVSQYDISRYTAMAPINPGSHTGITYTIGLYAKTSAGQVNHVYQAQFEKGKHPSSYIVTGSGATYTRKGTVVKISNNVGARIWPAERGDLYFRAVPLWGSDEFTGTKYMLYLFHDSDNYVQIYRTTGEFTARLQVAGTAYYSKITSGISWSTGDELKIGLRWMKADDLGNKDKEAQLFADFGAGWLDGTVAKPAAALSEKDASYLQVGASGTPGVDDAADAYLKFLRLGPEPLLLEEMKALP